MVQLNSLVFALQGEQGLLRGGLWVDVLVLILLLALLLLPYRLGPLLSRIQRSHETQLPLSMPTPAGRAAPKERSDAVEEIFDKGMMKERRRYRRRWGNPLDLTIKTTEHPIHSLHGIVVNRSERGVALLVDEAFQPKVLLDIRTSEAPEDIPWVPVQVCYCRSAGHNWLIGCRFQEDVPWKILAWFG